MAGDQQTTTINVLEKILLELKPNAPELAHEINDKETKINGTNAQIVFHNGSYIKVVTASDSARGNRATLLLLDEFRLIDKDTIDTVLRKFLTQNRRPRYDKLSQEEKKLARAKETKHTIYLSSAWWSDHWSYRKCEDTCRFMLSDSKRQFVCGLPYQLSIYEGLLDREMVEDEMAETDFSEIKFAMEYEAMFYGATDGSFFDFASISKNRKLAYPMLPNAIASKVQSSELRIVPKQQGEKRILSADIALMKSKKHGNDASAIFINRMLPTKSGRYVSNFVYTDSMEGLRTEEQALLIRKLYEEYDCDYIVLDANGIGLGVYDCLARDMVDQDTGDFYPALSCCNNSDMASRCTVPGAEKVIWSIKASAQFNSDCAFLLREGFRSGRVRLLQTEYDGKERLTSLRGFSSLTPMEQMKLELPYIHTTLLIDEVVKLQHEETAGRVKLFERSGMRKDRYSSLSYNYYVAMELESKLMKRKNYQTGQKDGFIIKPPSVGKGVNRTYGRKTSTSWK